jgi:hypothetical protein
MSDPDSEFRFSFCHIDHAQRSVRASAGDKKRSPVAREQKSGRITVQLDSTDNPIRVQIYRCHRT